MNPAIIHVTNCESKYLPLWWKFEEAKCQQCLKSIQVHGHFTKDRVNKLSLRVMLLGDRVKTSNLRVSLRVEMLNISRNLRVANQ